MNKIETVEEDTNITTKKVRDNDLIFQEEDLSDMGMDRIESFINSNNTAKKRIQIVETCDEPVQKQEFKHEEVIKEVKEINELRMNKKEVDKVKVETEKTDFRKDQRYIAIMEENS